MVSVSETRLRMVLKDTNIQRVSITGSLGNCLNPDGGAGSCRQSPVLVVIADSSRLHALSLLSLKESVQGPVPYSLEVYLHI